MGLSFVDFRPFLDRWQVNQVSLEFEAPDLAGWLWLAVAVLAAAEGVRFVMAGGRRTGRLPRAAVAAMIGVGVAALKIRGWLRLDESSHGWACVWLGVLGAFWLARAYGRTTRVIGRRVRLALLGLRMGAAALILLVLAGPVCQSVQVRHERAVLGILLDDSRSMTLRDAAGQQEAEAISRLEMVEKALADNGSAIRRLAKEVNLRWFTFAADVEETTSPSLTGEGSLTALAEAVGCVHTLLGQAQTKVAGVMVISDGRDNLSSSSGPGGEADPAAAGNSLAAAGVPLYAVGVGSEMPTGETSSLQARRLDCPDRVAVLNRLEVHAEFAAAGLADTSVSVELLFDGEVVAQRDVRMTEVRELISVDLSHVPNLGGLHRVTIRARADAIAGERVEAELSQFVRVTDDKIHVLYIDRARYERAAVARALESAKELRVRKVDLSRPTGAGPSPLLPRDEGQWQVYQVVLIGDVDREAFDEGSLAAVRDQVIRRGCGLGVLAGVRTLGSGKYDRSPLQEVLPVDLGAVGQFSEAVPFGLTAAGRVHPICQLGEEAAENEEAWQRLPPLAGASRLGEVGPAAEVLMQSSPGEPLLVVREAGKGRTAVLAFDSTWQWALASDEGVELQRRFWRQLVLWLANRRPEVWVLTDRPSYDLARLRSGTQQVVVRAGVTDSATGEVPGDVSLTGTVTGPDGRSEPIRWVRKAADFEGELPIDKAGEYQVAVEARFDEETIGQSETAFVVTSVDLELADTTADLETLKRMAERTGQVGGRYVSIAGLDKVLEQIRAAGHVTEIRQVRRRHLVYEHPWSWLVLFVALVTLEWVIRRRAGLV